MDRANEGFSVSGARTVQGVSRQVRRRTRSAAQRRALPASLGALSDWESLKRRLYAHDWVVYAKQPLGGPAQVLDYLGRYTHRVAISNERIVGIEGNEVLLRVRADPAAGARRTVRIPGPAFIHRFLQHVLPAGFKRIRHYGLLSPARKKDGLAAARAALGAPPARPVVIESVAAFLRRVSQIEHGRCPNCATGQFRLVATIAAQAHLPHPRGPP
ncbi:MAG: transposase [Sterolibacteriaceae bacterium]|nr:transposase [Sterolibacteriaceae bacterium]